MRCGLRFMSVGRLLSMSFGLRVRLIVLVGIVCFWLELGGCLWGDFGVERRVCRGERVCVVFVGEFGLG